EFLGKQLGDRLHRLVVAGAAVEEEDADLLLVGAARDLSGFCGLVDRDAHVPVEPERMDAEDVLGLAQRQAGPGEHGLRARDGVLARHSFGRLPGIELGGDVHGRFLTVLSIVVPAKAGTHTPCLCGAARSVTTGYVRGYGSPLSRGRRRRLRRWIA